MLSPGGRRYSSNLWGKRVVTPSQAIKNGAKLLVVGRPITRAEDPAKAADIIVEEIEKALV